MDVNSCAAALRHFLHSVVEGRDNCADLSTKDCLTLLEDDEDLLKIKGVTQLLFYSALNGVDTLYLENIITLETQDDKPFSMVGYPKKSLVRELSKVFMEWKLTGESPIKFLTMFLLNETENDSTRIQTLTPLFVEATSNWENRDIDSRATGIGSILKNLTKKGICTLLRLRRTQGSLSNFPVGIGALLKACNCLHAPESCARLTVAGRALSKHAQRSTDGWWGDAQGTEGIKNYRAEKVILQILRNATWINIHSLPHELPILEVRTAEGYGARWLADGTQFRGFLEPQMQGGHEKGWIH